MVQRVSRRALTQHVARRLLADDAGVIDELAAIIAEERRERELDAIVRTVEAAMADLGLVVATVESAHPLSEAARQAITELLVSSHSGATSVRLREVVRPELIGGVKVTTPTAMLDATIAKKLNDLRANNK
ncbi:MAG: F0F1 ATP synthase subunit delta [Candidatus Saccharibacteria bacterium]|nr:F0F1 ATP synthase subunit delta [Candidatus Saccharibacteria bacterium]